MHASPSRTWVVRVGGHMAASLCISDSTVREFAGSRQAILDAASRDPRGNGGGESRDRNTLASDAEMISLASALGLASRSSGNGRHPEDHRSPAPFSNRFRPIAARTSVQCGNDASVRRCPIVFRIGGESVTRVHGRRSGSAGVRIGGADRVTRRRARPHLLRAVFPLPLPAYGLNYI